MTDLEYLERAETLLHVVEANCDRLNEQTDADIDNQRTGGMVTLGFADGSQIVINLQKPLQEVWLAARSGGYHYRWADGAWRDTKTGEDFFVRLTQSASEHAGVRLVFASGEGSA
ncbi:MAG: iron donor protein CyaY [Pseudomonadota bacterium]|nr:iron donor protein CyaY [Pseudomonadota bacterium]